MFWEWHLATISIFFSVGSIVVLLRVTCASSGTSLGSAFSVLAGRLNSLCFFS